MNSSWKRKVALFFAGQTITLLGSALVQYAISWHITLTTQSGLMITIATLCGFLPQVLISLFAGVWADRFNRKTLIIIADGMIAACTALLAILFYLGRTNIELLFFISIIRSLGSGIQTPAVSAMLPLFVPQEHLMRVNSINATIMGASMLFALVAAGWLYASMGLSATFLIDVVTAAIGIGLLLLLKVSQPKYEANQEHHFFAEMFGGLRYVTGTKWLRQFLSFYLFYSLMLGPCMFLTPLMVARSFGPESWRLVVHEVVFALGSMAGGVLVGMLAKKIRNQVHMLIIGAVAFGIGTFIMGFSPNFWFYLGVMLAVGVALPLMNTGAITVLQTKAPPEYMGRIFGLVSIIGSSTMPLSMVFLAPWQIPCAWRCC